MAGEALALTVPETTPDVIEAPVITEADVFAQPEVSTMDAVALEVTDMTGLEGRQDTDIDRVADQYIPRWRRGVENIKEVARNFGAKATAAVATLSLIAPAGLTVASAEAHTGVEAHAAKANVHPWTHYGGDPQWKNGTHSKTEFVKHLMTKKDEHAMRLQGLTTKDIKAIREAARDMDNIKKVHHKYGTVVKKMTYGNPLRVESNAKFLDKSHPGGFDAYEVTATEVTKHKTTRTVKGKKVAGTETDTRKVTFGEATKCGNAGLYALSMAIKFNKTPGKPGTPEQPGTPAQPGKEKPVPGCEGDNTSTNTQTNSSGGNAIAQATCGSEASSTVINKPICSAENSPGAYIDCSPATPGTPETPEQPHIKIAKHLIESFNPDGTPYSDSATKHGNVEEWEVDVTNDGNTDLANVFTDTPPEGEAVINSADAPEGLKINTDGSATWTDVLKAGATETFIIRTKNYNMECYVNEKNQVVVVGTSPKGTHVTDHAEAEIKENNSADCDLPAPGQGPGQPVPTA